MKKYSFFILLLFLQTKTEAQIVFCPPGAEWHYSFQVPWTLATENEKIKYVRDSVLGIETVKVLSHSRFLNSFNSYDVKLTLTKQFGNTVFMRNSLTKHNWQILYNYAATPGQSWTTSMVQYPTYTVAFTTTVVVDSVKNVTINNFNLRRQFVRYLQQGPPQYSTSETIDERIGCGRFLFNYFCPTHSSDGDHGLQILCYQDDTFGLKQFTSKPCNYTDYTGISENYQNVNIKIYPNPANDVVAITAEDELINGDSFVSIKDLTGREIKQATISNLYSDPGKIDISDLAKGVYILNLSNNNEVVYTGKLVKSE